MQRVTGVVVNDRPRVFRTQRRALRQEIYYCEKYGVQAHLQCIGETAVPQEYLRTLLGRISYAHQIDPEDQEIINYQNMVKMWMKQRCR